MNFCLGSRSCAAIIGEMTAVRLAELARKPDDLSSGDVRRVEEGEAIDEGEENEVELENEAVEEPAGIEVEPSTHEVGVMVAGNEDKPVVAN